MITSQQQPLNGRSLRAKAVSLLARREYSRQELFQKLSAHCESADELAQVLEELSLKGLLSDERAAGSVVRQRSPRFGNARVAYELRQKGIDEDVIGQTLSEMAQTEEVRLAQVWEKKFGKAPANLSERARQQRFLQARGFLPQDISRLFSRIKSQVASG